VPGQGNRVALSLRRDEESLPSHSGIKGGKKTEASHQGKSGPSALLAREGKETVPCLPKKGSSSLNNSLKKGKEGENELLLFSASRNEEGKRRHGNFLGRRKRKWLLLSGKEGSDPSFLRG